MVKKRKFRKDLLPYLPEQIAGARYEDGYLYTALSANEYHAAVMYAMCKKQQTQSETPGIPVVSFDVIKNIGRFATAYRVIKTAGDGFIPLAYDEDKLDRLFFYDLQNSNPAHLGGNASEITRAANVTDKQAVLEAQRHLPKTPRGVHGKFCIPVAFDTPIAKDKRRREYNGACFVLKNGGVQNIFPFIAD